MYQLFKVVSLTHKKTPLAIRELLSLNELACRQLLRTLRDELALTDLLVLSTCNRTEVYYSAEQDHSAGIIERICRLTQGTAGTPCAQYFSASTSADEAVQHLFEVAMGLDAQVVGDLQISNQVKQAYQWSADEDAAGPFLHRLLHIVFFTNKRVQQETSFRDGAASTSYATLELVERLTAHLTNPRVLLIGLGEIGMDTARHFGSSRRFQSVTVCNRTRTKADALAQEYVLQVLDFADLSRGIEQADIIISCLAAPAPFVTQALVQQLPVLSHKFFVDLSVPRSIEPTIENIPGVLLYTLDNIQSSTSAALECRLAAVPQVRTIIAESVAGLQDWSSELEVSPTIQKLKGVLENLRQEEMKRFHKKMSLAEINCVDEITRSLMQKILKQPVLQLKAACKRGETGPLVELLTELFDLESQPATVMA